MIRKDKHAADNLKKQIAVLHGEYIYSYLSQLRFRLRRK